MELCLFRDEKDILWCFALTGLWVFGEAAEWSAAEHRLLATAVWFETGSTSQHGATLEQVTSLCSVSSSWACCGNERDFNICQALRPVVGTGECDRSYYYLMTTINTCPSLVSLDEVVAWGVFFFRWSSFSVDMDHVEPQADSLSLAPVPWLRGCRLLRAPKHPLLGRIASPFSWELFCRASHALRSLPDPRQILTC